MPRAVRAGCLLSFAIGLLFVFVRAPHPWGWLGFDHYQDLALALDFLSAVERTRRPEFLGQCTDIARLSREKTVVQRAREVARAIAAN